LHEARAAGRRVEAARRKLADDVVLVLTRIALVHGASALQLRQQRSIDLLRRTGRFQRGQVVRRSRASVAGIRQVIRLEDEGADVARLGREHRFDLVDIHARDGTATAMQRRL
jgi:hypothetical protein